MKKVMIAIVAIAALGSAAFAGEFKKDLNVMIGYASPGGDIGSDYMESAVAFAIGWDGYQINETFSVGAEYFRNASSKEITMLGITDDYELTAYGLLPYVKASKEMEIAGKTTDLYGLMGFGFYGVNAKWATIDADDSETGFHFGGGMMFPLKDNMKLGLDLRYHIVAENLNYFVPAAKFTYSF